MKQFTNHDSKNGSIIESLDDATKIQWFDVNDKLPPPETDQETHSIAVIISEDRKTISLGLYAYARKRWFYYGCGRKPSVDLKNIRYWGVALGDEFPRLGCAYYTPEDWHGLKDVEKLYWCNDYIDESRLKLGLVFDTYEKAAAHLQTLPETQNK